MRRSQKPSSQPSTSNKQSTEYAKRSIDFVQAMFFIQTTQVAVGLFSLPRIVAEEAQHNGWMAILIVGAGIQLSVLFMILLLKRFDNLDIYQILQRVFGKWIGNAIGLLFAIYCVASAAIASRAYVEIIQSWLFPTTQTLAFYLLILLPMVYCATGGARVLGRFAVMTFFLTGWILLLLIGPMRQIDPSYYFPLSDVTMSGLLNASYKVSLSALGFELLLVVYPFFQKKEKAMLAASLGTWFTTVLYLLITLIAIGFMSQGQLTHMLQPTLYMFHVVELPILERFEQLTIATWSFLVVNTAANYLWAAGRYVRLLSNWKEPTCVLMCAPLMFGVAVFPSDVFTQNKMELYLGTVGGIVCLGLAPLVLLFALLFKKKGGNDSGGGKKAGQAKAEQGELAEGMGSA